MDSAPGTWGCVNSALPLEVNCALKSGRLAAGNTKIVVNEFNNSLIIQGTESDIQFILETVKQLDTLPRQVFIEAQVVAVELTDDLSYGVNAYLQERGSLEYQSRVMVTTDGTIVDQPGPATTAAIVGGRLAALTRIAIGDARQLQLLFTALREVTRRGGDRGSPDTGC